MKQALQQKTLDLLRVGDYNSVIKLHKGLAHKVAGKFAKLAKSYRIDADDLVQWAMIEMHTSCKSYEADRGMSFASYAFRNMQRTLSKKVRAKQMGSLEVSLEEVLVEPSENCMEEVSIFVERVSEAMALVFDKINTKTQWIAFVAFMEGESLYSVAKEIGCSPQNLNFILSRLLKSSSVRTA